MIGFGFVMFVSFRLTLVPTLAVCALTSVLKTSWKLMKGNCWRLFGNSLLLLLIVLVLWIIAMIVEKAASEILFTAMQSFYPHATPEAVPGQPFLIRLLTPSLGGAYGAVGQYIKIIFDTLNLCVLTGLLRAFYCSTTRILYQEHHIAAAKDIPAS